VLHLVSKASKTSVTAATSSQENKQNNSKIPVFAGGQNIFGKILENQSASIGGSVQFKVGLVTGIFAPTIKWYFNGAELKTGINTKVINFVLHSKTFIVRCDFIN